MNRLDLIRIRHIKRRYDGGPGSGNWGHEGVKGQLGGSAPGGGAQNRLSSENGGYTSFAKERSIMAQPRVPDPMELIKAPEGTVIIAGGEKFEKRSQYMFVNIANGEKLHFMDVGEKYDTIRIAAPEHKSIQFQYGKELGKPEAYSDERKAAAFHPDTTEEANDKYWQQSGELWKTFDEDTKEAIVAYTGDSSDDINASLRSGKDFLEDESSVYAERLTEAIGKSELKEDAYFYRGEGTLCLATRFGISEQWLKEASNEELQSLVGKEGTDKAFLSTGSSKDAGFGGQVKMVTYAPKGTKALFVEPVSDSAHPRAIQWDGETKRKYVSSECETIIQRNSTYRITSISKDNEGKILVETELVKQSRPPKI